MSQLTDTDYVVLQAAMKKAVAVGIVPKIMADEETYLKYWDGMWEVIKTIKTELEKDDQG